jgi:hypothetical protein
MTDVIEKRLRKTAQDPWTLLPMPVKPRRCGIIDAGPSMLADAPSSVSFNKLRKRLIRNVRQAIEDFAMVAPARPKPAPGRAG